MKKHAQGKFLQRMKGLWKNRIDFKHFNALNGIFLSQMPHHLKKIDYICSDLLQGCAGILTKVL